MTTDVPGPTPLPDPDDPAAVAAYHEAERERGRLERIACVEREQAEWRAAEELAEARAERGLIRSRDRTCTVFSLRLDPRDRDRLERQAALMGIAPSVFARNLIRIGLSPHG